VRIFAEEIALRLEKKAGLVTEKVVSAGGGASGLTGGVRFPGRETPPAPGKAPPAGKRVRFRSREGPGPVGHTLFCGDLRSTGVLSDAGKARFEVRDDALSNAGIADLRPPVNGRQVATIRSLPSNG